MHSISVFSNTAKQNKDQNKDHKQYTSIKSYKPSVYGEDLLAKVEKKISFGV